MKDLSKIHRETPKDSKLRMALSNGLRGETLQSLATYTPVWKKWHDQEGREIHVFAWLYIFDPKDQGKN